MSALSFFARAGVVLVGAIVGYVAASADVFSSRSVDAATELRVTNYELQKQTQLLASPRNEGISESSLGASPVLSAEYCADDAPCCDEGLEREVLLAQANTGERGVTAPVHFVAQAKAKTNQGAGKASNSGGKKPNILVIWGDDIGTTNVSAYSDGLMGYTTPNIDRIANEGLRFLHYYGEQSCTAGRAAFLTGQHGIRTGLTKVGLPGAPEGMKKEDPTIATLLKAQGYITGQFGKNHLGDRDEMLPTAHGFDEFFGNLYHLNAEEEPENPDYPKNPEFKKKFGPRGVIHSFAGGEIKDTGPLTRKRMETIDEEVTAKTLDFMDRAKKEEKPFFIWWNSTRMHIWTHLKKESIGRTGLGIYPDGMVEHDGQVGQVLAKLKELGLEDNTIVMYSTDNGGEMMSWPDGGTTMFRGEKNTNWEGGYRVPCAIRWPGVIKPGTIVNEMGSHEDMLTTLVSAAGDATAKADLLKGRKIGDRTYKVHLDGYDLGAALKGEAAWPRKEFIYWTDDGSVAALRYDNWKIVFLEQRAHGFDVWEEPFVTLRVPKLFNLRTDPFERADHEALGYSQWRIDRMFAIAPAGAYVGQWLQSFREFPPRQKPGSFNLENVMEAVTKPQGGAN